MLRTIERVIDGVKVRHQNTLKSTEYRLDQATLPALGIEVSHLLHVGEFRRCVTRYSGNYKVRDFTCWDQFLAMALAQMTFRESLMDIEICLRSRSDILYHLGFRSVVAHSTLADANRTRDWRIYTDLAQGLIRRARRLYAQESLGPELDQTV